MTVYINKKQHCSCENTASKKHLTISKSYLTDIPQRVSVTRGGNQNRKIKFWSLYF